MLKKKICCFIMIMYAMKDMVIIMTVNRSFLRQLYHETVRLLFNFFFSFNMTRRVQSYCHLFWCLFLILSFNVVWFLHDFP